MAKQASSSWSKYTAVLGLGVVCILLIVANVVWLGKVKAERRVAELEEKLKDNNQVIKDMKAKLSSASTQQEAEHDRAFSLQERVVQLESQLTAAQNNLKTLPSLKPVPPKPAEQKPPPPPAAIAPPPPVAPPPSNPPAAPASPALQPAVAQPIEPGKFTGQKFIFPVVVMACNRPGYLDRTLTQILQRVPKEGPHAFEVWVSQDGAHEGVRKLVTEKYPHVHYIQHLDTSPLHKHQPNEPDNYYKIARHYGWCFNQVFADKRFEFAIVLEDDLEVAPDFFDYMAAGAALLQRDPSLWTVSAWNDNGLAQFSRDPSKVYRTDFFAGLGWLLSRRLWDELGPKWPKAYWDDWMREPPQRRGRASLRPEISRTVTFGKEGSSMGQFFDSHLSKMVLNTAPQPFISQDWSYLMKAAYDPPFLQAVKDAALVDVKEAAGAAGAARGARKVLYRDYASFKRIADRLGLMSDEKAGVPRTAYLGVVTLSRPSQTLYVAPESGSPYYKQEV